jgi:hypothetical protein
MPSKSSTTVGAGSEARPSMLDTIFDFVLLALALAARAPTSVEQGTTFFSGR